MLIIRCIVWYDTLVFTNRSCAQPPQQLLRRGFYASLRNEPLDRPLKHYSHCFDSLRQYIMCDASTDLFYTWGREHTGKGQIRECKDWSALRQWATEHTACDPDDAENRNAVLNQQICHGPSDGLLE